MTEAKNQFEKECIGNDQITKELKTRIKLYKDRIVVLERDNKYNEERSQDFEAQLKAMTQLYESSKVDFDQT